jgi:hypothetical protein
MIRRPIRTFTFVSSLLLAAACGGDSSSPPARDAATAGASGSAGSPTADAGLGGAAGTRNDDASPPDAPESESPDAGVADAATSSDGGGACGFTACGGDVVGRWKLVQSCGRDFVDSPAKIGACPDESRITRSWNLKDGEEVFEPDGGYWNRSTRTHQKDAAHLTSTCIARVLQGWDGGAPTCEALGRELLDRFYPVGATGSCTPNQVGGCDCELLSPDVMLDRVPGGSWQVQDRVLVTSFVGGQTLRRPFCAAGDRFVLKDAWVLEFERQR